MAPQELQLKKKLEPPALFSAEIHILVFFQKVNSMFISLNITTKKDSERNSRNLGHPPDPISVGL